MPQPKFTEAARQNNTQGTVLLQVEFLANAKIGKVSVIEGLPFGLTEEVIEAAKEIKFKPSSDHGIKKNLIKTVIYNFSIF